MVVIFGKELEELVSTQHVIQRIMELFETSATETAALIQDAAIRYRTERRETTFTLTMANSNRVDPRKGMSLVDGDVTTDSGMCSSIGVAGMATSPSHSDLSSKYY